MTVADLIQKLKNVPQHAAVLIAVDAEGNEFKPVISVDVDTDDDLNTQVVIWPV